MGGPLGFASASTVVRTINVVDRYRGGVILTPKTRSVKKERSTIK